MNRFVGAGIMLVVVLAACGDDRTRLASVAPDTSPGPSSTSLAVPETMPPATSGTTPTTTSGTDRADAYLASTTELYRRTLPDGQDFVVRLSADTYADVFGLTWTAPTGSAELCLGDHAMFMGVPGDIGDWGSAWVSHAWFDAVDTSQPAVLQGSMWAAVDSSQTMQFLVVRTVDDVEQVVLSLANGDEVDRASVSNRIAMVAIDVAAQDAAGQQGGLIVTVVDDQGRASAPVALNAPTRTPLPAECGPGDPPQRELPGEGEQPPNPSAAEEQIRERHALLVDRTIDAADKPADLIDDDTGVDDATARLNAGPYREAADSAVHSIEELVFTSPTEAWFRYTITTSPNGTFSGRFGMATFNGSVWQITRATVCQDLALALAPCEPNPPVVEPPSTPEWEAAWQEWMSRAMLYNDNDGCPPLSQC